MKLYELNIILFFYTIFSLCWYVYNKEIRTDDFHPVGQYKFYTPKWMSCAIPYVSNNPEKDNCENVKIDGWSVLHFLVFLVGGMVLPRRYITVIILSILCEIYEYHAGWRARFIIDPVINLLGYFIGCHLCYIDLSGYAFLYSLRTTIILSVCIVAIYYCNRPCMIGKEFT